jgi:type IV pilus assembly protein PilO
MSRAQRIWLMLPIGVGAALAMAMAGWGLVPEWLKYQKTQQQVEELRSLESQLPLLEEQLERDQQKRDQAEQKKDLMLRLIAGSGSLSTLIAELDRIATTSAVELTLVEPQAATVAAAPPSAQAGQANKDLSAEEADAKLKQSVQPLKTAPVDPNNPNERPKPPPDPLETDGLRKKSILLTARGGFPALLAFMRKLEQISVLAVQSNLQLALECQTGQPTGQANQRPQCLTTPGAAAKPEQAVTLKLNLALYSKDSRSGLAR